MSEEVYYLTGEEKAPAIIWAHALAPGKVKWRGDKDGHILGAQGEIIGSYYEDRHHSGYSVWTKEYAGFAYHDELELGDSQKEV